MKRKLQRFAENDTFSHVFQPKMEYPLADHEMKGKWNERFFQNENPVVLELGCGRGEYTVELAEQFPEKNFIGIDKKGARLWRGAKTVHENAMKHVAFMRIQIQTLVHFFHHHEVSEIWITFPDPHPQIGNEKRRLTSPRFLDMYKSMLKPGGVVHLKTDNEMLYNYSLDLVKNRRYNIHVSTNDLYESGSSDKILGIKTTYEKIFLEKGFKICYLKFSFE